MCVIFSDGLLLVGICVVFRFLCLVIFCSVGNLCCNWVSSFVSVVIWVFGYGLVIVCWCEFY